MKPISLKKLSYTLAAVCLLACFSDAGFAQDKDWRPVTPTELAAKPVVEPDADAEAIFWEVRVDDSSAEELALKHYVRVKIFTERGRDQFSRHDVVFTKGTKVKGVEARVTKPDGTAVFLKPEDVMEREIVKALGPNGIFINVGRGSVVDEPALIAALKDRKILSAGLDVFANEPHVPAELLKTSLALATGPI